MGLPAAVHFPCWQAFLNNPMHHHQTTLVWGALQVDMRRLKEDPDFQKRFGLESAKPEEEEKPWRRQKRLEAEAAAAEADAVLAASSGPEGNRHQQQ